MDARFENHGDPGRPLTVEPHAEGVRLRLGDMGITDVSIVLTPRQSAKARPHHPPHRRRARWRCGMSGLKDVKFLIPQSADEFIEQAPGQYDAMKKAVREATMDNHDEPMSVDDFVRSHSQLFILIKSAVREVLHEDAPALAPQGRGHGPFSDLFEADGASGRPVRSYVVPGIRELAAEDDPSLRPGRRGELLGDRLRFGVVERSDQLVVKTDIPLRHVITSLLCVGVLIVSLKLVGKEAA